MASKTMTFVLICFIVFSTNLFSQKWGKVSKEELKMTSIPEDPEADAVILYDLGKMEITENFKLKFNYHCRIKILTEQGKEFADRSIEYWKENVIDDLEAQTFLPNGKKVKLDKKQFFEQTGDFSNKIVFTFPGVEVGSVLEYRYEMRSEYLAYLHPWVFQSSEYTRLSQLEVILPQGFNYTAFFTNYIGDTDPASEKIMRPGSPPKYASKFTWRLENLQGIKSEPYMSNADDYSITVYFQLVSYRNPLGGETRFIKSWDDLAEKVYEVYKPYLTQNSGLKDLALEKVNGITDKQEQMKALYDFVRDEITTSHSRGYLSDKLREPDEIWKLKEGSAVEKNLLLLNLLNHAGFEAHPVVMSTWNSGKFRVNWAQLQQFNHTIALVKVGQNTILMDTGNKYCPFGLLPANDLNYHGLMVQKKKGDIVEIPAPTTVNMQYSKTLATLNDEGQLNCQTVIRGEDYRAIELRSTLSRNSHEDVVKTILEDNFEEVQIDSFTVDGFENVDKPVSIVMHYQLDNFAQTVGDKMYLNPAFMHRRKSNPFKRETRSFPVEFNFCRASTEEVEITLPEGMKVVELPKLTKFTSRFMQFNSSCQSDSNLVTYGRFYRLKNDYFEPRLYSQLRDYFEQIVSADQGQIVLSKD